MEIVSQAMEVYRSPKTRDTRRTTPRHKIIKMAKINNKDRLLKAARDRNKITYKGKSIRLSFRLTSRNFIGQNGVV